MIKEHPVWRNAEECLAQHDKASKVRYPIGRELVELSPKVCKDIMEERMDREG